jgi:hypothetical protein
VAEGNRILESRLGEKLSVLYRIGGDPQHPFSEVVGLLQRVDVDDEGRRVLHVCRRDGSLVAVAEPDVIRLKFVPPARGALRRPAPWGPKESSASEPPDPPDSRP